MTVGMHLHTFIHISCWFSWSALYQCLQYSQGGGPIIAYQIENEYGSFGKETEYLNQLREVSNISPSGISLIFILKCIYHAAPELIQSQICHVVSFHSIIMQRNMMYLCYCDQCCRCIFMQVVYNYVLCDDSFLLSGLLQLLPTVTPNFSW